MANVIPTFKYPDARAAIGFLVAAFGFTEHAVHEQDGRIVHAELRLGDDWVMLGDADGASADFPSGRSTTYVIVDDPDAHHARAVAAGAEIVRELVDQDYGSREYAAKDPAGNVWSFGTYRPEP
jgi:uncharacterized glyoxalase superfamily protein PhnB